MNAKGTRAEKTMVALQSATTSGPEKKGEVLKSVSSRFSIYRAPPAPCGAAAKKCPIWKVQLLSGS